jgi:predicted enzyme related to lactoylglutathione lyase
MFMTPHSMPNPVVHFEILGRDRPLLEAFYTSVFDWHLTSP